MSKVIHIWRMTNRDDTFEDAVYYTTKQLRDYIVNDCYDCWEEKNPVYWVGGNNDDTPTKEQLLQDEDILLNYVDSYGFTLECIATVSQEDFN